MSKGNWLDDLDHDLAVKDLSPYTRCNMRKLIAAVRLAEKHAKLVSDDLSTSDRVIAMAQITSLLIRLRSGDMEEKGAMNNSDYRLWAIFVRFVQNILGEDAAKCALDNGDELRKSTSEMRQVIESEFKEKS